MQFKVYVCIFFTFPLFSLDQEESQLRYSFPTCISQMFVSGRLPNSAETKEFITGNWALKTEVVSEDERRFWLDSIILKFSSDEKVPRNVSYFLYAGSCDIFPGGANVLSVVSHTLAAMRVDDKDAIESSRVIWRQYIGYLWTMLANYKGETESSFIKIAGPDGMDITLKDVFLYDYTRNDRPTKSEILSIYRCVKKYDQENPKQKIGVPFLVEHLKTLGINVNSEADDNLTVTDIIDARHLKDCERFFNYIKTAKARVFSIEDDNKSSKQAEKMFAEMKLAVPESGYKNFSEVARASREICSRNIFSQKTTADRCEKIIFSVLGSLAKDANISASIKNHENLSVLFVKMLIDINRNISFRYGDIRAEWISVAAKKTSKNISDSVISDILGIEISKYVEVNSVSCAKSLDSFFKRKAAEQDANMQYILSGDPLLGSSVFFNLSDAIVLVSAASQRKEALHLSLENPKTTTKSKIELLNLCFQFNDIKVAREVVRSIKGDGSIKDATLMEFINEAEKKLIP